MFGDKVIVRKAVYGMTMSLSLATIAIAINRTTANPINVVDSIAQSYESITCAIATATHTTNTTTTTSTTTTTTTTSTTTTTTSAKFTDCSKI